MEMNEWLEKEVRKEKMKSVVNKYKPENFVTSKTKGKEIVSRCIQFCIQSFTKNVFEFLYGVSGDKKEVPKRLRTLDKYDIMGLVLRPRAEAWVEEETVDPHTLLLVGSFRTIDPHYQYAKKEFNVTAEEEEEEGGTYGEFLEEEEARDAAAEFHNVTE